ncbi:hypothetical protein BKA08_001818 [Nocardioides marinisabuli]|uniref:Sulfotransferase family protein n=1 Tax=Nocardioides marinisabuli TaxID=419476 RepID=A0A7Y9JQM9_9ACTN|nr:hypothetical protein [Nocardioides marinisabuli]NYD57580.1 hypothetical protein [Nocardioides marinisabuli]
MGVSDARPEAWRSTALSGSRAVRRTSSLARWISRNLELHEKLVIKDPRLSWFLDVWIKVAGQVKADLSVIIMLRPPHEVLASKHTYYQGDQAAGYNHLAAAWINMLLNTELQTRPLDGRGVSRIFVEYSELLTDWRRVGRRIGTVLGDEGLNRPSETQVASVEAFLDAGLRRMDGSKSRLDLANEIGIVLAESWVALQRLTDPKNDGPAVWDELDSLRRRYEEIYGSAQSVTRSTTEHAMRSMRPSRRISEGLTRRLGQNDASSAVAPFEGGRGNVPPGYVHLVPHWLRDRVPKSIKLSLSRLR